MLRPKLCERILESLRIAATDRLTVATANKIARKL
jgi:hypothetical protein